MAYSLSTAHELLKTRLGETSGPVTSCLFIKNYVNLLNSLNKLSAHFQQRKNIPCLACVGAIAGRLKLRDSTSTHFSKHVHDSSKYRARSGDADV